jgi:hypothetical protein
MAPGMGPCKAQLSGFQRFPRGVVNSLTKSSKNYGSQIPISANGPSRPPRPRTCGFYILLCMFNGFAFARPFCQAIKVSLTGVEF